MNKRSHQNVIITVTGKDVPGITSSLINILNRDGVCLIDMQQAVTLGILSLSFVIQFISPSESDAQVLKDLLFKAKALGVTLDFQVLEGDLPEQSESSHFAITLLSNELQARHVAAISAVLAKRNVNIDSIRRLSEQGFVSLELIVNTKGQLDLEELKDDLLKVSSRFHNLDIAVQRENLFRRSKRLVVMDMDSTVIQVEVIDELAKVAGVGEQVSRITEEAMNGYIDFDESLRRRVALLEGLSEEKMKQVAKHIPLTSGAENLVEVLKRLGYKIALISGGFSYFGEVLKEKLGLDYVYTNVLEIADGKLTGRLVGNIVNADKKAEILEQIAAQEKIGLESVIAIGDGANDVPMLKKAGLGIAFNGKRKTREAADAAINQKNLDSILYLLGITQKDMQQFCLNKTR